jgi:hypothetical protein
MRKPRAAPNEPLPMLPPLPTWISTGRAETPETAAFRSGAALAYLSAVTAAPDLPLALWRDRLALNAAEVCVGFAGRREGAGALRDAHYLTSAGDDPGPAGRILRQWRRTVAQPISVAQLGRALESVTPERIASCLDAIGSTPIDRAAQVIESVLGDNLRAETEAVILADAVLARSMRWTHVVPLLGPRLKAHDMRLRGNDLRLACHRAVADGVRQAVPIAAELARGAVRLRAVTPKLRAKAAARAVDLFLSRDALSPATLAKEVREGLSDRAARRLCERLVELGALRELTGRDSFRLFGI